MPTAEAPAPEYLGKIGDEADDPPASVVSSSLLYIEDNPPNVELVESIIQRRPTWKLIHAGHGALGVELAGSSEPTLIFLDLGLPDMNGLDVLRSLRDAPRTSEMPVVVVSADASENQIRKLLSAGAHGYLTKPLDVNDVLGLLDRYAGLPI